METVPVTLIVKAPNQQIEDQTIKCELSWTINKLKQHLSEVYPSKPPKHEQKLIYSGQLLPDTVVLRDVLRQYDGQETHTVHLVCTTRQNTPKHQPTTSRIPQNMPETATNTTPVNTTQSTSNTNLEQRIPNIQWPNNMPPMDPNQFAMQMAWMQQAYMQYMTQYMNLSANSGALNRNFIPQETGDAQVNNPPDAQEVQAPQAQQRQRDPENPDRDWLDVFYILTRVLVLFSVVYFYSSPLRFIFVLLLGFGFYLYQIGFFRNLNNNNNNHNNNNVQDAQGNQEIQNPSVLTIVWTFFTTFFASLIPEVPQAV
ncbi:hypothetical protein ILUMI_09021 [Ignelater luminosus]|uniref:Ubiquitin-like domain-containing protein n=1 Tax=Ignelater luminosus TaxID=2038154 RepID=A0A8K0D0L2_IGNLU|nr:hypothetical protein ILUMI_09021 [Ignelater luminosus]